MGFYALSTRNANTILTKIGRPVITTGRNYSHDEKDDPNEKDPRDEMFIRKGPLFDNRPDDVMEKLKPFFSKVYKFNPGPNKHLPFKVVTLDDLPQPGGSWLEEYKKRNRRYWIELIFGITFFSLTMAHMIINEPIFWNWGPPPMPPKEERIKSFWDPPDDDDEEEEEEEEDE